MTKKLNIGQLLFLLFSFFIMWEIFAGNFYNDDYYYYESEFDAGDLDRLEELNIEPLYTYLIYYSKQIFNFKDYVDYKAFIAFFFMIPYWYTIAKWSEKPSWTALVFAPIFLLQIIIVRNFMAFAIMSLAIPLLANKKHKKKSMIIFGLMLLIAEGFHNMMFVYLLCYLSLLDWKLFKQPVKYFCLCAVVGLLLGGFLFTLFINSSAKYTDGDGYNTLRMVFGLALVVNYYVLNYIKKHTYDSKNNTIAEFEDYILKLNLIFIGLTVVFVVSIVAARLYINLLLFNIIFVINRLSRKGKRGSVVPISLGYMAFWIYYVVVVTISVQLEEIFIYNSFIIRLLT